MSPAQPERVSTVRRLGKVEIALRRLLRKVGIGKPLFRENVNSSLTARDNARKDMEKIYSPNNVDGEHDAFSEHAIHQLKIFDTQFLNLRNIELKEAIRKRKEGLAGYRRIRLAGKTVRKRLANMPVLRKRNAL